MTAHPDNYLASPAQRTNPIITIIGTHPGSPHIVRKAILYDQACLGIERESLGRASDCFYGPFGTDRGRRCALLGLVLWGALQRAVRGYGFSRS